jgi:hypothetical protein
VGEGVRKRRSMGLLGRRKEEGRAAEVSSSLSTTLTVTWGCGSFRRAAARERLGASL